MAGNGIDRFRGAVVVVFERQRQDRDGEEVHRRRRHRHRHHFPGPGLSDTRARVLYLCLCLYEIPLVVNQIHIVYVRMSKGSFYSKRTKIDSDWLVVSQIKTHPTLNHHLPITTQPVSVTMSKKRRNRTPRKETKVTAMGLPGGSIEERERFFGITAK